MRKVILCLTVASILTLFACEKTQKSGSTDTLAVDNGSAIIEKTDIQTIGLITSENDNNMIGQDIIYENANDTFTLSLRRSLPKSGKENIMFMVYYDKLPVDTSVSSLVIDFKDGKNFSIDSQFFMPLKTGQFGTEAGKDSGKNIQGLTVVMEDQFKYNLKNNDISKIKAVFDSGDQVELQLSPEEASKVREFLNTSFKQYL